MKILFICNDADFFFNHFSTLAKYSCQEGHEVIVLCGGATSKYFATADDLGITLKTLDLSRSGVNPLKEISVLVDIYRTIKLEKPDLVQLFTIKPCIYGGIVARMLKVKGVVGTVTGLGYTFSGQSRLAAMRRSLLLMLYRLAFGGKKRRVRMVFENQDDKSFFEQKNVISPDKTIRVWGAGVDLQRFSQCSDSKINNIGHANPRVLLPARMLKDKGVLEFVAAAEELKKDNIAVEMVLAGGLDPANPASLKEHEIKSWVDRGIVTWLGHCSDMPTQLNKADVVCLPSYREGMPKVLLEAMSCGKAIITTDAPGCREVIEANVHGVIVPVADHIQLKSAILRLVSNPKLVSEMGAASRQRAEQLFGDTMIAKNYFTTYRTLLD